MISLFLNFLVLIATAVMLPVAKAGHDDTTVTWQQLAEGIVLEIRDSQDGIIWLHIEMVDPAKKNLFDGYIDGYTVVRVRFWDAEGTRILLLTDLPSNVLYVWAKDGEAVGAPKQGQWTDFFACRNGTVRFRSRGWENSEGVSRRDDTTYINVKFPPNVTAAVGGILIPVDKLGLLAPYIGLTSTIIVAAVATAIYVKRVKRRREKQ
jgi:hypothetical protein